MKTNNAMSVALLQYQIKSELQGLTLSNKLQKLLTGGICEMDGGFFLKELLPESFDLELA